jgi:hypothetical protein
MSNGPYPIYGSEDENDQNFPMPGDNPVPQFESIEYDTCPDCDGQRGWWSFHNDGSCDSWIECDVCGGTGRA